MSSVVVSDMSEQLGSLLEHMGRINASDLYLIAGHPAVFRVDDASYPARVPLEAEAVAAMAEPLLHAAQAADAQEELTVTFAWREDRFHVAVFQQRGALALVVRRVSPLRALEELGFGTELRELALITRGLVLVTGDRRSGRSTTLAALIDYRNAAQSGHILTIEDPIEHVHTPKQSIVTQREIGSDTLSYASALRSAPSMAPDLIFVDEIKDAETMEALLALADAGYACIAALHASSPSHALERVMSMLTGDRRAALARSLRAVIAQRLVAAQSGRTAVVELLLDTSEMRELIRAGDFDLVARTLEEQRAARSRDSHRAAVPLRLAADVYEQPLVPNDRRVKSS